MTKNARILGIRLDDHTNQRLTRFEEATLIEGVSLGRAALCAALDSYEENQSLSLPLKIVSAEPCANTAPSTSTSPENTPTRSTRANIVSLPPPPVVGTLLHVAEGIKTTAVTTPPKEVRYAKPARKKS